MNRRDFLTALGSRIWQVGRNAPVGGLKLGDHTVRAISDALHGSAFATDAAIYLPASAYASLTCQLRGIADTAENRDAILDALPKDDVDSATGELFDLTAGAAFR